MNVPALVLLHGYPFDHTLWDQVAASIGGDLKILTPDLRGFGGQPASADPPSLDRMAEDINRLLDQHEIGRAVIAGMSMGGYVALAFAQHYPGRLAGLGLVSTQARADTEEAKAGRRAMIEKIRREGPDTAAQAAIPKLFAREHANRPEFVRFPATGAAKAGAEGLAWALEAMARRPDRTPLLESVRVPVLVIHGVEDQFIPAEKAKEMAKLAADSAYLEIPNAGHATPVEAPAAVAQGLVELMKRSYERHTP